MKKKTLKIMTLFIIGLFSVQQGFPLIRDFFIDPVYALQEANTEAEPSSSTSHTQPIELHFSTEFQEGKTAELISIEFTSNQPLDELDLVLPAEAKIATSALPEGVVIQQTKAQQWRLLSQEPLSEFLVPLTFEEAGTYEIQVADETLTVEIAPSVETADPETSEASEVEEGDHSTPDTEEQPEVEAADSEIGVRSTDDDIFTTPDPDLPFDPNDEGNIYLLEGQEYEERGVSNWTEFLEAVMDVNVQYIYFERSFNSTQPVIPSHLQGGTNVGYTLNNSQQNISSNDVWLWLRQAQVGRTLIVDGKGLTLDLQAVVFGFTANSHHPTRNWDVTFQNMKLYSGSRFGAFNYYSAGNANVQRSTMRYHNVIHEGNRLIEEPHVTLHFSGHFSSHQSYTYSSIFNPTWEISSGTGNRERPSIEANRVTIEANTIASFSSVNAGNFDLRNANPRLIIGENATLTLEANGSTANSDNGQGINIFLRHTSGSGEVSVGKGATVNLYPQNNRSAIGAPSGGTTNHTINLLEDSTMNIVSRSHTAGDGQLSNIMRLRNNTNLNLGERSTLNIETLSQSSSAANIIHFEGASGTLTVGEDATLDIQSRSTATGQNLIFFNSANASSRFVIDNAKKVNLQKLNSMSTGNLIQGGGVTARRQSIQQWSYGNTSETSDFHWVPIYSLTANISNATNSVTNVLSVNSFLTATETNFISNFASRSNRWLFEQHPTVEVRLNPLTEDPASPNSRIISGYATPGSYILFKREGRLPEATLETQVSANGERQLFHTVADQNGYFEYDLSEYESFQRFWAGEVVEAQIVLYGEWSEDSVIVEAMADMDPKDPLAPDNTVDPDNPPDLTESKGAISIDFISQFNFGRVAIQPDRAEYPAQPQQLNDAENDPLGGKRPNYIQISDRRLEATGWTLSARLGDEGFVSEEGRQLRGARILLNNIEMVTTGSNESEQPAYWNDRVLDSSRKVLATAQENTGTGTWIQRYGDQETMGESVFLEVPPGASPQATNYTGTIHWELSFVPGMD